MRAFICMKFYIGISWVVIYIYIYIYMCVCVCVCVCVYLGSIYSLMHISLNNVRIFCLYIYIYMLLSCHIDFMVLGWNWLMKLL